MVIINYVDVSSSSYSHDIPEMLQQQITGPVRLRQGIGDDRDFGGWIVVRRQHRVELAALGIARRERLGQKAQAEAENGQPARLLEMLRKARHMAAKTIALTVLGLLVRLVRSGQDEGVAGEFGGVIDGDAIENMGAPAIGPVDLAEQKLVAQVGVLVMGRGDADLDLVAQHTALDDIPGGDADEDLDQFMSPVKGLDGGVDPGIDEVADELDADPLVAELEGLIVLSTLHEPVVGEVSWNALELKGEALVHVNTARVSTVSAPVAAAVIAAWLGSASEGSNIRMTRIVWVSFKVSLS